MAQRKVYEKKDADKGDHTRTQKEPLEIKIAPDTELVKSIRKEMEGLQPHEINLRIANGLPTVVTYPHCEYVNDDGDYIITHISKPYFATAQEQQKAATDASPYRAPKMQAVAKETKKKTVHHVMELPVINADEWEDQAIDSQGKLQDKVKKLIDE